jgi:hypothetical protein
MTSDAQLKASTKRNIKYPSLSSDQIDKIAGAFTERGWNGLTHVVYILLMLSAVIMFIVAISSVGGGTKHAWSEYDETLYEETSYNDAATFYSAEAKADIYFVDLNIAYKEIVWATFTLTTFMACIIIVVVASNVVTAENCHVRAHNLVHQLMMYMSVISIIGLILIITRLHNAYEGDDQLAGVHMNQANLESGNTVALEFTEQHRDGWPVNMIISSLLIYITAPVICIMLQLATFIYGSFVNYTNFRYHPLHSENEANWLQMVDLISWNDTEVTANKFSNAFRGQVLSIFKRQCSNNKCDSVDDAANKNMLQQIFIKAAKLTSGKNQPIYNNQFELPEFTASNDSSESTV